MSLIRTCEQARGVAPKEAAFFVFGLFPGFRMGDMISLDHQTSVC